VVDRDVDDALARSFLAELPAELAGRLRAEGEVLEQTAVNAFGSVRQRVAAHLLDLASDRQRPGGRLVAHVSQQELADAAGSVREVVARALRDLRVAGIVATAADSVVILDPARLYAESGGPAGL
jgi:CRP/FNR family transcriptional regulator